MLAQEKQLPPDALKKRLSQRAREAKADVIVCGHSHLPFAHQVPDALVVNPGSVGWSSDGKRQASYAILAFEKDDIQVHHHRLEYDVDSLVTAIRDNGLPEVYIENALGRP